MEIIISGIDAWTEVLDKIKDKLQAETFSKKIADLMQKYVHVRTGQLQRSIFFYGNITGATAPYAFVEVERGGEHDFVSRALSALDLEDTVTEALYGIY